MQNLLTIKELSDKLRISERKIHDLVKARVISAIKISYKCIRYNYDKVVDDLERHYGQDAISSRSRVTTSSKEQV